MRSAKQMFGWLDTGVATVVLSLAVLAAPLFSVATAHAYFVQSFTGMVSDQYGNGIAGVQVHFAPLGSFAGPQTTDVTTSADGTYDALVAAGQLYGPTAENTYYSFLDITFTPPENIGGSPIVLSNYQLWFDTTGVSHILNQQFNTQTLAAPLNLAAASPTQESALSWNAVSGAASYKVYRDNTVIAEPTVTSYADTDAAEGSHAYAVAAVAANGTQSVLSDSITVVVDRTAPATGALSWSANPIPLGSSGTLALPVSDTLSSVAGGEYFVGSDPGAGSGTVMSYSSGVLSATLGSALDVGVYDIGVRARDAAGNWSPTVTTMLVIYNPVATLGATGKDKKDLVPSLAAGDILPGLTSSTQTNAADYGFTVQYKNGALDPKNDFHFAYSNCGNKPAGNDCHSFNLDAASFAWIVVDQSNSRARFQGIATLTVDSIITTNPFTVQAVDGDNLPSGSNDTLLLKVYAPGADPATATPLYRASGSMAKGNAVRVQ